MIEAVVSGGSDHARPPRPARRLEPGEQLAVDGGAGRRSARIPAAAAALVLPVRLGPARRRAAARRYAQEPLADDILATAVLRHRTAAQGIATAPRPRRRLGRPPAPRSLDIGGQRVRVLRHCPLGLSPPVRALFAAISPRSMPRPAAAESIAFRFTRVHAG